MAFRQDYRLFKLTRIKNLKITEQNFVRATPDKVLKDMHLYADEAVALTLLFNKGLAYRVYENFDNIEETADGNYLVNISLPNNESLYRFLLSFGDMVEVLSPPEVREKIIERIRDMKNKYET